MAKFCVNCGNEIANGMVFCSGCGAKVEATENTVTKVETNVAQVTTVKEAKEQNVLSPPSKISSMESSRLLIFSSSWRNTHMADKNIRPFYGSLSHPRLPVKSAPSAPVQLMYGTFHHQREKRAHCRAERVQQHVLRHARPARRRQLVQLVQHRNDSA